MIKKRPFLKWAGNKYRSLKIILTSLPSAKRLIEPFVGSGTVFVNSNYDQYLLADQNQDLINLFTYVQQEGEEFINYCDQYFGGDFNNAHNYYQLRLLFNSSTDQRLRAALFLYLNRHGYNGLCRFNLSGGYNVPFGRYKLPSLPRQDMAFFHQKSQKAKLLCADFRATFAQAKKGDVIYCDPPYVPLSESAYFSAYTSQVFSEADQIELASLAAKYAKRGVVVVISNHDTPFTRHHYRNSLITAFPVQRMISCKVNNRMPVQELIAVFS